MLIALDIVLLYIITDPHRFVFQINMEWSDGSLSTSHRSYSEFFDFQCDLLVDFPKEAGTQKGYKRSLPYLPGKKIFHKSNRKLAESRITPIDMYIKALVSMSDTVMRCERTCRFFKSNWQEDRLRSGERLSMIRYTVKTLSRDQLIADTLDSRESSEAPHSPNSWEILQWVDETIASVWFLTMTIRI